MFVASVLRMSFSLMTRVRMGEFLSILGVRVPVTTSVFSSISHCFSRESRRASRSLSEACAPADSGPAAQSRHNIVFLIVLLRQIRIDVLNGHKPFYSRCIHIIDKFYGRVIA